MRSRELRGMAFVFVNDYFVEDTGELVGVRADFLHEFRVKMKLDFDPGYGLRYGTYLLSCGQKLFADEVSSDEISEKEVFTSKDKRMVWLGYSMVKRYDYSVWMRLRVTKILACSDNLFNKQRVLCTVSSINGVLDLAEKHHIERIYVLPNLFTGLVPVIFTDELKQILETFNYDKLYLGYASPYRSLVVYPFQSKRKQPKPYCGDEEYE